MWPSRVAVLGAAFRRLRRAEPSGDQTDHIDGRDDPDEERRHRGRARSHRSRWAARAAGPGGHRSRQSTHRPAAFSPGGPRCLLRERGADGNDGGASVSAPVRWLEDSGGGAAGVGRRRPCPRLPRRGGRVWRWLRRRRGSRLRLRLGRGRRLGFGLGLGVGGASVSAPRRCRSGPSQLPPGSSHGWPGTHLPGTVAPRARCSDVLGRIHRPCGSRGRGSAG